MKLTDKEIELINKHRADEEAQAKFQEEREKAVPKIKALEEKFKQTQKKINVEIDAALKRAEFEINKAINISEKNGIPFKAKVVVLDNTSYPFTERGYMPKSFSDKWGDVENKYNLGTYYSYNEGWEYWSQSSMSC